MRIAVTGPTGAIGHALIEECGKNGDEVVAIVRPGSRRNESLKQYSFVKIVEIDSDCYSLVNDDVVNDIGLCDVFYHLAWQGTTGISRNDMHLQCKNIKNSLDAVSLAKKIGCNRFIGAGSQAEYGRVEGKITSDVSVNPENGYGMAKYTAGNMTRVLCEQMSMEHIWTRVLSVYGPYDGENSMISSSLNKMMKNEEVSFTKGEQLWDYLYSADAGKMFYLLANKGITGKTYIIGKGHARPLADYIKMMSEAVGYTKPLNLGAIPYSDKQVMHLEADISEFVSDTGYVPGTDFVKGIVSTIGFLRTKY